MIKSQHIIKPLLCTLFLLGCKKDEPIPCQETGTENCEDIQNAKNFFFFKVGSWWVYEEENSGDLDTVFVTSAAHNPSNYDFDVRVYSTYQDYYYHFWPQYAAGAQSCNDNGEICQTCLTIKRSKYKSGDFVGEAKCMFFIPKEGLQDINWTPQYNDNRVSIEQIKDTFVVGGITYDRTIVMHEEHTLMEDYQESRHYFSENVGLVRKDLIDSNKIWKLVDYYLQP